MNNKDFKNINANAIGHKRILKSKINNVNIKNISSFDCPNNLHIFQIGTDCFALGPDSAKLLRIRKLLFDTLAAGNLAAAEFLTDKLKNISVSPDHIGNSQTLVLFMTHACNKKCSYCYDRFAKAEKTCNLEQIQTAVHSLDKHKHLSIHFFGGEPLLEYLKIVQITTYCESLAVQKIFPSVSFSITSNGTLLTQEMIDFFNSHHFFVNISIDGYRHPDTGICIGSIYKTLNEEQLQLATSIRTHCMRTTIMPEHINCISGLVHSLYKHNIQRIALAPAVDSNISYTEHETKLWLEQMQLLAADVYNGILPPSLILNFNAVIDRMNTSAEKSSGCGMLALDVDGTLYPCHRFTARGPEYSIEKIGNSSEGASECRNCWAFGKCAGRCIYEQRTNSTTQQFLCRIRKQEVELACWLAANRNK